MEKKGDKLSQLLKQKPSIPINEQHKEKVAHTLKAFMPIPEESSFIIFKQLFKQVMMEFWQYQKLLLFTLLLFLFGLYFTISQSYDYTLLFFITTPFPLFVMGWRSFEDYHEDLVELFSTYKFTFQQMVCVKIVIICSIAFLNYTVLAGMFINKELPLNYELSLKINLIQRQLMFIQN